MRIEQNVCFLVRSRSSLNWQSFEDWKRQRKMYNVKVEAQNDQDGFLVVHTSSIITTLFVLSKSESCSCIIVAYLEHANWVPNIEIRRPFAIR
jgi:hypothetical protein